MRSLLTSQPWLGGDPRGSQVNNIYIFPGFSFGAISCAAASIPESFFLVAAQASNIHHHHHHF
jgi:malic enzyme